MHALAARGGQVNDPRSFLAGKVSIAFVHDAKGYAIKPKVNPSG